VVALTGRSPIGRRQMGVTDQCPAGGGDSRFRAKRKTTEPVAKAAETEERRRRTGLLLKKNWALPGLAWVTATGALPERESSMRRIRLRIAAGRTQDQSQRRTIDRERGEQPGLT
jgi:hypothetical protein